MTRFAVGDIHGCFDTLQHLLSRLEIDLERDRLWLVGDLVSRGPRSLEVLRWARRSQERMGDRMVSVLGNHDVHLLRLDAGIMQPRPKDRLQQVLEAPDREDLLEWLRHRPLLHREGDLLLVHAGLLPQWSVETAERLARELEERLEKAGDLVPLLAKSEPEEDDLRELRRALRAFTMLRTCSPDGEPCDFSGRPEDAPRNCFPWFEIPWRLSRGMTVITGHWAALGLKIESGLVALDTGCAWGGHLTAVNLDDGRVTLEPAAGEAMTEDP